MTIYIISVNPILFILSYLYSCSKKLELDNIENDNIFYYDFSLDNYDKNRSYIKYFTFIHDICITLIKQTNNNINTVCFLIEKDSKRINCSILHEDRMKYNCYKMVLKHKWEDKNVKGFFHSLRVYSNGVLIHSTKLFKFIYKIDKDGIMTRRRF